MYISEYQVHLVDTQLTDGNHHLLYNLQARVSRTANLLDSKHMILCNGRLDLNLHPIGILFEKKNNKIVRLFSKSELN